ncbi:MAG: ATP-binding cassette domain-containing protein [Aigarchaeota archaeon]|nr:ATP-binding cassette domain-containing protein [Candidatus Pelearchaeum maunauluense]
MTNAVILENVSKRFDEVWAVRGLSLTIQGGSIFGLLGPNGSVKSTTMRMMLGLLKPDSGMVSVHGIDPSQNPVGVKRIVGYVQRRPGFTNTLRQPSIWTSSERPMVSPLCLAF